MQVTPTDPEVRDSPIYWFFLLTTAKDKHLFEQAAEAQRQLERLGVRVRYTRPNRARKAVAHAS